MKKLVWTAVVTGLASLMTGLSFRLAAAAWRRVTGEEPPEITGWARMLVGKPVKKGVLAGLHAPGVV